MSEPELHTNEAHQVIAAVLVACTLGQRRRPELRTDPTGALARLTLWAQVVVDGFRIPSAR